MNTVKVLILLALSSTSVFSNSEEEFTQNATKNDITFQKSLGLVLNNVSENDLVSQNFSEYNYDIEDDPEEQDFSKILIKLYNMIKKALFDLPIHKYNNTNESQTIKVDSINKGNIANNQNQLQPIETLSKNVKKYIQTIELKKNDRVNESQLHKDQAFNEGNIPNLKQIKDQSKSIKIISKKITTGNVKHNIQNVGQNNQKNINKSMKQDKSIKIPSKNVKKEILKNNVSKKQDKIDKSELNEPGTSNTFTLKQVKQTPEQSKPIKIPNKENLSNVVNIESKEQDILNKSQLSKVNGNSTLTVRLDNQASAESKSIKIQSENINAENIKNNSLNFEIRKQDKIDESQPRNITNIKQVKDQTETNDFLLKKNETVNDNGTVNTKSKEQKNLVESEPNKVVKNNILIVKEDEQDQIQPKGIEILSKKIEKENVLNNKPKEYKEKTELVESPPSKLSVIDKENITHNEQIKNQTQPIYKEQFDESQQDQVNGTRERNNEVKIETFKPKEENRNAGSKPSKASENNVLKVEQEEQQKQFKKPLKKVKTENVKDTILNIEPKKTTELIETETINTNITKKVNKEVQQQPKPVKTPAKKHKKENIKDDAVNIESKKQDDFNESKTSKVDGLNKNNTSTKNNIKQIEIQPLPNKKSSKNVNNKFDKSKNVHSVVNYGPTEKIELLESQSGEDYVSTEKKSENKYNGQDETQQVPTEILSKNFKSDKPTNTTVKTEQNKTIITKQDPTNSTNEDQIINNKKLPVKSIIKPDPDTIANVPGKEVKPIPLDTATLIEKINKLSSSNKYVIIHPNGELEATNTTESHIKHNGQRDKALNEESANKDLAEETISEESLKTKKDDIIKSGTDNSNSSLIVNTTSIEKQF